MCDLELHNLIEQLVNQPKENEWVEFKLNFHSIEEIGESLSALSNGACINNKVHGYLVFGVRDADQTIEGTSFRPKHHKKGNEELEHWIAQRLNPKVDYAIYEFDYHGKRISLFEVQSANNQPVEFLHNAYIRVGSITRKLNGFPAKARKIWNKCPEIPFEKELALKNINSDDVIRLLDTQNFFDMLKMPYPTNRDAVIERFLSEKLLSKTKSGLDVTNLGALLFAKDLNHFDPLARKAPRVIIYKGKNKLETIQEQTGWKGYAVGFQNLVDFVKNQLPTKEVIESSIRRQINLYPELAVRELIANALIHQDFFITGTGPMIEIFSDRIEMTNPGLPLITTARFIDEYQSRNEALASLMRRLGICEEKGSGIDNVVAACELYQLPAPDFVQLEKHTKAVLFNPKTLNEMNKKDRVRSCYQHCCLKYVSNEKMTNQSLRERFKIEEKNASIASRIIKETMGEGFIKYDDPESKSKKYAGYIPFWA